MAVEWADELKKRIFYSWETVFDVSLIISMLHHVIVLSVAALYSLPAFVSVDSDYLAFDPDVQMTGTIA